MQDGNVFVRNAETTEESLYLSNSTFVRNISGYTLLMKGGKEGGTRQFNTSILVSSQAQVEATDYLLSGDYRYVAFESNYTKVRNCLLF